MGKLLKFKPRKPTISQNKSTLEKEFVEQLQAAKDMFTPAELEAIKKELDQYEDDD